jgi:DNA-binding IclR family transcriptional regulator
MSPQRAKRAAADREPEDEGRSTNATQKVCAILRALSAGSPQRLAEISAWTGLNKVTALRILETLIEEGFVEREADGRGFARGREILALAASAGRSHDVRELARPSLVRLADLSEDTALLSVRSGLESVCIDRQIGAFPIRANYLNIGSRRPLGVGAGALAILAWLPERETEAVLGVIGPHLAPYPRMSVAIIRELVAQSRERGCVVLLDRVIDRMSAIGVPILAETGAVIGALSIAALTERISDRAEMLRGALLREADLIRREMGRGAAAALPAKEPAP